MQINKALTIQDSEINFSFLRASGPGGQNVNKVSTAVQLRFDILHSPSLPEEVKIRLLQLAGKRVNDEGIMIIEAKRYRTQDQNRSDAEERFKTLILRALIPSKKRKSTKPSPISIKKRLEAKKRRSETKVMRKSPVATEKE